MPNVLSTYPWQQSTTTADSGVGAYAPNNTAQMQLAALMAAEANAARQKQATPAASGSSLGYSGMSVPQPAKATAAVPRPMAQQIRKPIWLVPQHGYGGGGQYVRSSMYTPNAVFGGYETSTVDPNTGMTTDNIANMS